MFSHKYHPPDIMYVEIYRSLIHIRVACNYFGNLGV